jgi:hypothetical protein
LELILRAIFFLFDFETTGQEERRIFQDYTRNYMNGLFGALPFIEFHPVSQN